MIEMGVRAVTVQPHSRRPVAVLQARGSGGHPTLALGIPRAEACALAHELVGKSSLRQQSLALLARCLEVRQGRIAAVRLAPGAAGTPTACLELAWPDGRSDEPITIGQALGVAVALRVPLLVSEALLTDQQHVPAAPSPTPASGIPPAFDRAFRP